MADGIAAGAMPPPPQARRRRLGNLRNVKGALGDVIHRIDSGELDVKRANSMIYGLSTLTGVIAKEIEIEELRAIEEQLEELRRSGVLK
jgi:hypothetical protein